MQSGVLMILFKYADDKKLPIVDLNDLKKVLKAARKFIGEKPRTFAEISDMLIALMPEVDVGAMRYSVRTHLPLVQVPIASGWSYSSKPEFTLAEEWIGRTIAPDDQLPELMQVIQDYVANIR